MVIPVRAILDITGKTISADVLLTRRKLDNFSRARDARDVFTVKDNEPNLLADVRLFFEKERGRRDFREPPTLAHDCIEQRAIRTTDRLNDDLNFPGVGQACVIERHTAAKKNGKTSTETVYAVTGRPRDTADAARAPGFNRGHCTVENGCHDTLDWNRDEDRCTIRTGHGHANITALRRFAIGAIKATSRDTVSATIQRPARNLRPVFDDLRMSENSRRRPQVLLAPVSWNGSAVDDAA
jgi:hypothetical protein